MSKEEFEEIRAALIGMIDPEDTRTRFDRVVGDFRAYDELIRVAQPLLFSLHDLVAVERTREVLQVRGAAGSGPGGLVVIRGVGSVREPLVDGDTLMVLGRAQPQP